MKKFKRIIALVTVAMFILSFAAPTFAADTASNKVIGQDIIGTKYEEAAKKLIGMGIIKGFEDGTIRPESEVTRAQFAVIVALELGLGDVSPSPTKFPDVTAAHWASGAVNLAVGKGIIKGYPDGTFKPDQPVTYAEACAMLTQMLGYGPALKEGSWPATPIYLAASSGVTKGVYLGANDKTPRGEVIMMAANALTANFMEQDTWGPVPEWKERQYSNLLWRIYDISVKDKDQNDTRTDWNDAMPTVDNAPRFDLGVLKSNEIELSGSGKTYKMNKYFDPNQFFGQQVEVWVNENTKEIFYIGPSPNQTVINDTIKDWEVPADPNKVGRVKLDKKDKWYEFANDNVEIYVNIDGNATDWDTLKGNTTQMNEYKNADIKVVLNNNNKIEKVVITDYYRGAGTKSGFVKSVDKTNEIIKYINDAGDETDYKLEDFDYAVVKNGVQGELADLAADDVVNMLVDETDEKAFIFATSKKVNGKVDKTVTSNTNNTTDYDVFIGGTKYKVAQECTFSDDNNESVAAVTTNDLNDLGGKDATVLLDAQGKIKHIVTKDATESSKLYGVLVRQPQAGSYDEVKLTLVNKSGTEQTFTFDYDDVKINGNKPTAKTDWTASALFNVATATDHVVFVEYKLNSSGKLSEVKTVGGLNVRAGVKVDADEKAINLNNGTFKITDKTVIWDATGWNGSKVDNLKKVAWTSLDNRTVKVYAKTNGADVEYLIVATSDKALGTGGNYGVVKGFTTKGGDAAIVILDKNGEDKVYVWDEAVFASSAEYVYDRANVNKIAKGDFVYYSLKGEGDSSEIDTIATLAYKNALTGTFNITDNDIQVDYIELAKVSTSSSSYIKAKLVDDTTGISGGADTWFTVNSNTVYFDITDNAKLNKVSGVSAGDLIVIIDTDDDSSTPDFVIIVRKNYSL